jgi:formate dehydrogenase beta subunit
MENKIIKKIEQANLLGRGGASFPTYKKWQAVKQISAKHKYIVCNCSEGEPGVFKDGFILKNYPDQVINGLKVALKTIDKSQAYLYLRKDYYRRFSAKLKKLSKNLPITVIRESGGYLAGEETSVCEEIEGRVGKPRQKPPFPSQEGIFGCPTLINNLETFYMISQISQNKYQDTRFYSLSGHVKKPGVYELPINWSIKRILKETSNWPEHDFFMQIGGGASGEILLDTEANKKVGGSGAIVVFDRKKTDPYVLMKKWAQFFLEQNCDKCVPCREGVYRIFEMLKQKQLDPKTLEDLFLVLDQSSYCALGRMVIVPFRSLIKKVL